jgi:anti-anti-sigma factor
MKIELEPWGEYLLVKAKGRLDVSWADYFTETFMLQIREGRHNLMIDASEMVFSSFAGIRALLQLFKRLNTVRGSLLIVNATSGVRRREKNFYEGDIDDV